MASPTQFGGRRSNIWSALRSLSDAGVLDLVFSGTPVNGTSGTYAGKANVGTSLIDITTGNSYRNVGTLASPIWSAAGNSVIQNGGLGVVGNAKMTYDFAVDGGAISTITPANSPTIPQKAIILGGVIDITTTVAAGAGATIALGLGSGAQVAALKAATGFATYTAGLVALIPVFTAATAYKVTAAARLTLTIATNTVTAGKFDVNVVYVMGN